MKDPGDTGRPSRSTSVGAGGVRDVTKRDGRRVRFDPSKIHAAVWRAMQAVGDGDEAFAEDVTAVVVLALEREASLASDPHWTPSIETVQDRVERALVEMGRAGVAKAYILYRDRRARARRAQALSDDADARMLGDTDSLRVRQADAFAPWSRGRIAAALVHEADLPRDVAADVARRVEERVLASKLSEVSTALVRALVDHELVASGMIDALRHTEPIALPRHDLRRLASAGGGAPIWEHWRRPEAVVDAPPDLDGLGSVGDMGEVAGGEVLRRFALTEILDRRSAELHGAGDLHVSDLRRPQRYLHLGVPSGLLGGWDEPAPHEALVRCSELLGTTSRGLTLDDAGPLLRAVLERDGGLNAWLVALGAVGRAAGQRICLRADDARDTQVAAGNFDAERAALMLALANMRHTGALPRVWIDVEHLGTLLGEDPHVREATLACLACGTAVASWHSGDGRPSGPGAVRLPGERGLVATAGAVAINLPRLAARVGPWNEEHLLEELFGLLSCALEAGRCLAAFQETSVARGRESSASLGASSLRPVFARPSYALVPVGLPQALRILGDGDVDPVQGARILGLVAEAAARFPEPGAPRFELCALFGAEAARRLAWSDRTTADAPRAHQAWLFAEMSGQDALVRSYTPGHAVGASAAWRGGEAEAELVRTVPSGLLHPLPPVADGVAPSVLLERFVSLRRASQARTRVGAHSDELLPLSRPSAGRGPSTDGGETASDAAVPTPLRLLRDGDDPRDTPR